MIIPSPEFEMAKRHFLDGLDAAHNNDWQRAELAFRQSLKHIPKRESTLANLLGVLVQLNKVEEAKEILKEIEENNNPDGTPSLYLNKGLLLEKEMAFEKALYFFNEALKINKDYKEVYLNKGRLLRNLQRLDAAISAYDKALEIDPNYPEALWYKSITLLLLGDYPEGWELYESRWENTYFTSKKRDFEKPLWQGRESLNGKTILLHCEQGLGDTIQFCRYARSIKALGATVILYVQKPLFRLLKTFDGIDEIVIDGSPLPSFDFHCPLMSLPFALKTNIDTIPSYIHYLYAEAPKLNYWKNKLGLQTKPRIGLVWSGNSKFIDDKNRSIELETLVNYLPKTYDYFSLQKELKEGEHDILAQHNIEHFEEQLEDFSDTAALCECMDLIISVDTSVAHLAGALGKKTWVLIPFIPDFRWLLDRTDSPWYPSMTLLRQAQIGDWDMTLSNIEMELIEFPQSMS
ncbi:MAG: glycosyltransferase family protein [Alphaproteobacteria bacterium]|nr:glycosyltransferase family protein [Alphaproteobacteria bacterium]